MVGSVPRVYKIVKDEDVPAKCAMALRCTRCLSARCSRPFPVLLCGHPTIGRLCRLTGRLPANQLVRDYAERFRPVAMSRGTRHCSRFTSEGDLHYYHDHEATTGTNRRMAAQLPGLMARSARLGSLIWALRNICCPDAAATCEP